ncbi:hypothetical protein HUJ05_010089 [Dendroctonus ponderosae]|nr:hypothetical protein HUJ05_010089 [Dendroctonus ponderosae]
MIFLGLAIFIFGSFVQGQNVLHCYECTPNIDCANHSVVPSNNCYEQLGDFTDGISVTCYSTFLNYTGVTDLVGNPRDSETGIYRDCGIIPDYMGDYCEWFIGELGLFNITVESCKSCNTSFCNNHVFNEIDGSIVVTEDDSGSYITTLSLILLISGITMTKFV